MSSSEGLSRLWVLAIYQTAELHHFHLIRLTTGFGMKGVKWWRSLQDGVVGINDPLEAICPQTHTHTHIQTAYTHLHTNMMTTNCSSQWQEQPYNSVWPRCACVCQSYFNAALLCVMERQLAESVSYCINCTVGVCMNVCVFAYTITYLMQTKYT